MQWTTDTVCGFCRHHKRHHKALDGMCDQCPCPQQQPGTIEDVRAAIGNYAKQPPNTRFNDMRQETWDVGDYITAVEMYEHHRNRQQEQKAAQAEMQTWIDEHV